MDESNRLEAKVDKIMEKVSDIDVTLVTQGIILKEHIRRTQLLEEKVAPLEKHAVMTHGVLKFVGLIAILIGIIEGIVQIIR
jgi:hypothetical protein